MDTDLRYFPLPFPFSSSSSSISISISIYFKYCDNTDLVKLGKRPFLGSICVELVLILKCLVEFLSETIWFWRFPYMIVFLIGNLISLIILGLFKLSFSFWIGCGNLLGIDLFLLCCQMSCSILIVILISSGSVVIAPILLPLMIICAFFFLLLLLSI